MTRIVSSRLAPALLLVASWWALSAQAVAAPVQSYIALGDSVAFGETDFSGNPSYGDRGYVKPYADFLASQNQDRAPVVLNLGVDGETTNTFFNGGPNGGSVPTPGNPGPQLNLNYPNASTTQNALLLSTIASEQAAGHNISTVSVQLGANDLYQLVLTPGFLALSQTQQAAEIGQTLGTIQANDTKLLTELHTLLPNANVLMMGYYNPFAGTPNSPLAPLADPAIKALNRVIAGEAAAFGAKYVDTYSAIVGHELAYTYIGSGNVHPNAAGYAAIADQMEASSVPEPTSVAVLLAGIAGLIVHHRRRQRIAR